MSCDDVAPNSERPISKAANARADVARRIEADAAECGDRTAQRRILGTVHEARLGHDAFRRLFLFDAHGHGCGTVRAHRTAHFSRFVAASAARSNASPMTVAGNSRCTRARPALPIAIRRSAWARNAATED